MAQSLRPTHPLRKEAVAAGLKWTAVRAVLPDWVEDIGDSKAGELELKGFFTRHFGLELDSDGRLTRRSLPDACFKTTGGTEIEQLETARAVATACAKLFKKAYQKTFVPFPTDAGEMRKQIVSAGNKSWIDLASLAEYCWSHGVPVLFLPKIPTDGKKMEGMVTVVNDSPVIVISKKSEHPDWILFILAHEVGHIACDHLRKSGCESIVDDKVSENRDLATDQQEREANEFASKLLTLGLDNIGFTSQILRAEQLAKAAVEFGLKNGISPGHVVLNVAHNTKLNGKSLYALGLSALKHIPKEFLNDSPCEIFRHASKTHLNPHLLSDDSVEYIEKLGLI